MSPPRAIWPTAEGDRAEGAAMVAAVLHLDEGAGLVGEARGKMRRGLAHAHDVADDDRGGGFPSFRRQLFGIADHSIDLGHRREARRIDLRRAPRHRDPRTRPAAMRPEEHTSELQSLMRTSYAVFC